MNVYGMARSFYEITGKPVRAYAEAELAPTRFTKIVDLTLHQGFSEDPTFMTVMRDLINEYKDHEEPVILIAAGDGYAELISKHKAELEEAFVCPYVDHQLLTDLTYKKTFYEICDKFGFPHPDTKIITKEMYQTKTDLTVPFEFPVALKPANSVQWLKVHFEGRKKAFTIHSEAEFMDIISKSYENGYEDVMILQDFIPGDDSNMRVLNAYVDQHHHVKMMCIGHPLLEDPTPAAIGNYVAIIPDYNQDVYETVQKFLEDIKFTGFANFDMKFDERDGQYKFFDMNLRQGRSSFFVTLNGYNLAQYLIDDYVTGELDKESTVYANKEKSKYKLWLGVPKQTFIKYARDNEAKEEALNLIKQDRTGTTVFYEKDKSFKRWLLMSYMFYNYVGRFKKYFQENKGQDF